MYTVLLGKLPPKKYASFEQAWDCYYLDARRGCLCGYRGCRCNRFHEIKALLAERGAVGLHAAVIYIGEERPAQMWHINFKRFMQVKDEAKNEND